MSNDKNNEKLQTLLLLGSDLTGSAASEVAGFAIGSVVGGPAGAAVGGVAGLGISKLIKLAKDTAKKQLSSREETRVGAAIIFSIEKIQHKLNSGEKIRDDGFFQFNNENSRSDAEEIFEGVLLKSKNTHEENKLKFIASLFANIAFQNNMSLGEANQLLTSVEKLTYRQIRCLSLFNTASMPNSFQLREESYNDEDEIQTQMPLETISLLQEIFELERLGLVTCLLAPSNMSEDWQEDCITTGNYLALIRWNNIVPKRLKLTALGKRYYQLMDLHEVPKMELEILAKILSK